MYWLGLTGAVGLAALLLWLRDRWRDHNHIPQSERKLSEQMNVVLGRAFISFIWAAAAGSYALSVTEIAPRVLYCVLAIALLGLCGRSLVNYHRISTELKRKRRARESAHHEIAGALKQDSENSKVHGSGGGM